MASSITANFTMSCLFKDDSFGPTISSECRTFDFTLLFEQSVLSLFPSALFLLVAPFRLWYLLRTKVKLLHSRLYLLKLLAIFIYFGTQLILLVLWALPSTTKSRASIASSCSALLDTVFIGLLSHFESTRSIRPSPVLNIYLLFSLIFDATQARTLWLRGYNHELAAVFSAGVAIKVLMTLMEAREKKSCVNFDDEKVNSESPEAFSSIYNRSVFWWLNGLFINGYGNSLQLNKLYPLENGLASEKLGRQLNAQWENAKQSTPHALFYTCLFAWKWHLLSAVPARLFLIGFRYAQPFLINKTIDFVNQTSPAGSKNEGYGLIGAAALIYLGIAVSTGYYNYKLYRAITIARGSLIPIIYSKTLVLDSNGNHGSGAVTLMSTDIERISLGFTKIHELWASVVEAAVGIYLLERKIGWACVAPIILAITCFLANAWNAKLTPRRQMEWVGALQRRVAMTSSILNNMKSVKMMGLGGRIACLLHAQRVRELDLSKKLRVLFAMSNSAGQATVVFSAPLAFMVFVLSPQYNSGNGLTAGQAFTTLSIIQLLTSPLNLVLPAIPFFTSAIGCFDRIQIYLLSETRRNGSMVDLNHRSETRFSADGKNSRPITHSNSDSMLVFNNCTYRYSQDSNPVLKSIQLDIRRGTHTVIIGQIGSGKTTLLRALLGEISSTDGLVHTRLSSIAYCQQTSWITNGTIRENIIGPSSFDVKWYETVLYCCALDQDISRLAEGEDTSVGSRGICLSGGQKQRLALARAVYHRCSTVVLDDIFSALDAPTAKLVYSRLFSNEGLFRQLGTTVILTTHSVQHLRFADNIVVLGECGVILAQGTYEMLKSQPGYVSSLLEDNNQESDDNNFETFELKPLHDPTSATEEASDQNSGPEVNRKLGGISVYKFYQQSIGWLRTIPFFVLSLTFVFCYQFSQIWLQWWTETDGSRDHFYLAIYCVMAIIAMLGYAILIVWVMIVMVPRSGVNMHKWLLDTVIHAPLSFFNSVDAGVTLNRFSQDMSLIHTELPGAALQTHLAALQCIAQIALIAIGSTYFGVFIPVCMAATYGIQKFYLRTSRQLRFLDLEAKSPIYTHFTETVEGLTTIRAFGWQTDFEKRSNAILDISQRPYYLLYQIQRWLNLVLDLFVAGLAVLLVTFAVELRSKTSAAAIGIALVNILGFSLSLSLLITNYTNLETSLGAVARVKEIVEDVKAEDLPAERETPPEKWPMTGALSFDNVNASYSPDADLVIRDLTLRIQPGEKIGICGRTGSGKSSLLSALLRLIELRSGAIYIDNVDISTIPRQTLRSHLIAIPQDPFLLAGDIRLNASPIQSLPDETLIEALRKVGLWDTISARGGLDADVDTAPLSNGQQQLFCLARAMLRQSTILILDEATSSVDAQTDAVMQRIIREEFKNHTTITVAHRLNTIVDCDRIVVLDKGQIVEVGQPARLLETGGTFKELWMAQRQIGSAGGMNGH